MLKTSPTTATDSPLPSCLSGLSHHRCPHDPDQGQRAAGQLLTCPLCLWSGRLEREGQSCQTGFLGGDWTPIFVKTAPCSFLKTVTETWGQQGVQRKTQNILHALTVAYFEDEWRGGETTCFLVGCGEKS